MKAQILKIAGVKSEAEFYKKFPSEEAFIKKHGKGSHGTICLGERCTTMKDRKKEIGKGLLNAMLEQLGVDKDEL